MRRSVLWVVLAVLISGPAFAQKVYIDYDKDYDRSKNKTFAWKDSDQANLAHTDPMLHSQIAITLAEYIAAGGLVQVDSDPDLYFTYHGSAEEEITVNTMSLGYSYPVGWGASSYGGYGGYYGNHYGGVYSGYAGVSTAMESVYLVGTLVVDVWDAKTETLVWRGIAADIAITENRAKLDKKIDKALRKMADQWRRMKKRGLER